MEMANLQRIYSVIFSALDAKLLDSFCNPSDLPSDIFKVAEFSRIQFYQDNIQILFHFDPSSTDYLNGNFNMNLCAITDSYSKSNLKLNTEKSAALLLPPEKKRTYLTKIINI